MDLAQYPGIVLYDTFQNASPAWIGVLASGAGGGLIDTQNTVAVNNTISGHSMQVTVGASGAQTRFLALRKFDITFAKKLGFNAFFCYDNPNNVAYIHFQAQWRDVDHGLTHLAAYRYDTSLKQWEYLPSTATSASGAFTALPNGATTMASGAGTWHEVYFDIDYNGGNYDEFLSGQIGIANPGNTGLLIPTPLETVEAQRMELLLGAETTGNGPGKVWFADVTAMEVD